MQVSFDADELRQVIREILTEVLSAINWPAGRVALTEAEAALAWGVGRHVLRDLRLSGKIRGRKLGKKVIYLHSDLVAALAASNGDAQGGDLVNIKSSRQSCQ